jgi:beta-lactamase class A
VLKRKEVKVKEIQMPVNRKLLVWLFFLTGILSLFFWWRGRQIHGLAPGGGEGNQLRYVINTRGVSPSPVVINPKPLLEKIGQMTATMSGTYAIYVQHLDDKTNYGIGETEEMPGASILKLPVLITAINKIENGELKFEDKYTLEEADRAVGSGPLQFKKAGTTYTVDELLTYLGKNSDNTAWVLFNRRWGKKTMQQTMENLGMTRSDYEQLTTTASEVGMMWNFLYTGKMQVEYRKKIWEYLTGSIYEDRIPAGLLGTRAEVVAHKVGTDVDVWADAGILRCKIENKECKVKPFILVILNQGVKRAEATVAVPQIAKAVWEFENNLKNK